MKKIILTALLAIALVLGGMACAEPAPADGLYSIGVSSNARMFRVVDCVLRVEDGRMTAVLTMSSSGYGYLYQGTSAEAGAAPVEEWTPHSVDGEGRHVFAVEIPALDQDMPMASWSIRYEKWYDRTLHFFSDTLSPHREIAPDGVYAGALRSDTALDGASCMLRSEDGRMQLDAEGLSMELASLDLRIPIEGGWIALDSASLSQHSVLVDDGMYTVDVATDSALLKFTHCLLSVEGGRMTARMTAKNSNFDYLYIGLAKDALRDEANWIPAQFNEDGTASYELPISTLDNEISVATYSAKKKMWYDRSITLDSDTLEYAN